jgi:hypothetical protein
MDTQRKPECLSQITRALSHFHNSHPTLSSLLRSQLSKVSRLLWLSRFRLRTQAFRKVKRFRVNHRTLGLHPFLGKQTRSSQ